jgi:hypothetical protein
MKHFYRDVIGLGNVAVSRHAQAQIKQNGIPVEAFEKTLLQPVQPDIQALAGYRDARRGAPFSAPPDRERCEHL